MVRHVTMRAMPYIYISLEERGMARKYHQMPGAAMVRAVAQAESFHRDLDYLVKAGISAANIAGEIGVSRRQVYEWQYMRYMPRDPLKFLLVVAWAEYLRYSATYRQVAKDAGLEPQ